MWCALVYVEWAKSWAGLSLQTSNNIFEPKDQWSCENSLIQIMCKLCTKNRTHNSCWFIWQTSFAERTPIQYHNYEPINHDQLRLRKRREKNSVYIIASPTHYLHHAVPREHSWSTAYEGWDWSSLDHNKASIITYSYSFTEESRSEPPWNTICLLSFPLPSRLPPLPYRSLVSFFIKRDQ